MHGSMAWHVVQSQPVVASDENSPSEAKQLRRAASWKNRPGDGEEARRDRWPSDC